MKSIVICGSMRYSEEIDRFASELRRLGVPLVMTPQFGDLRKDFRQLPERERLTSDEYRQSVPRLVFQHFDKIRRADIVFVYNKNGYIGVNTTLEVGFAHGRDMVIYALEKECATNEGGELCRELLFTDVVTTPEDLVERLKLTYAEPTPARVAPKSRKKRVKRHGR